MVKIQYYCDRCGKPTQNRDIKISLYRVREYLIWEDDGNKWTRMLCKDCLNAFEEWMEGGNNADSN